MANKNDLLRRINARAPQVVERVINLWDSPGLGVYINDLLSGTKSGTVPELSADIKAALSALKVEHDAEFPQHCTQPTTVDTGVLAENVEFKLVNARFPRIGQRIVATWGQASFCEYANDLINDKRDGRRQGFPEDVMIALFRLMREHDKQFPQFVLKISDIWSLTNKM